MWELDDGVNGTWNVWIMCMGGGGFECLGHVMLQITELQHDEIPLNRSEYLSCILHCGYGCC